MVQLRALRFLLVVFAIIVITEQNHENEKKNDNEKRELENKEKKDNNPPTNNDDICNGKTCEGSYNCCRGFICRKDADSDKVKKCRPYTNTHKPRARVDWRPKCQDEVGESCATKPCCKDLTCHSHDKKPENLKCKYIQLTHEPNWISGSETLYIFTGYKNAKCRNDGEQCFASNAAIPCCDNLSCKLTGYKRIRMCQ